MTRRQPAGPAPRSPFHRGRRLVVGLGAVGLMWVSSAAHADSPMEGVLEGNSTTNSTPWQTAYLMAEAAADARVVGPLNRGARVSIDPGRSSDQYWYVELTGGPASFKGYVWKEFVKVVEMADLPAGSDPAKTASRKGARSDAAPSVAPMAPVLADKDPSTRRNKAQKLQPEKVAKLPAKRADVRKKDDMWVAYDPELFEVSDESVKAVASASSAPAAPVAPPAPAIAHAPTAPAAPPAAPAPEPKARPEAELASPLKQIQELREQIERELEQAPQAALSETTAHGVDALMTRLNELLKVERSIVTFLESTSQMVESHDRRIKELTGKVATLSARGGPERSGISEEILKMRKRLDELSTTVSSTRAHAKRIDALEARLSSDEAPVGGLRSIESALDGADHGAIVVGAPSAPRKAAARPAAPEEPTKEPLKNETTVDVQFNRRAEDLEAKLYNVKREASALEKSVEQEDIEIPAIDARQVEREAKADRDVSEGVVEVRGGDTARTRNIPPGGTVAAMLSKLRRLREQRRLERESQERQRRGIADEPAGESEGRKARREPPPRGEVDAEPEAQPDPAPARAAGDDDEAPASAPAPKKPKMSDAQAKSRLMEIENLLSGRL